MRTKKKVEFDVWVGMDRWENHITLWGLN